jgi:NAD(P)-dependent dehydrogenase (short-subunit alcohol dehydrogenase family)
MKTMMVTGAGAGIGAAIATAAAAAGYRVVVCDVDGERARSVAAGLPDARGFQLDVSREADVERVLDTLDAVPDALINNAGIVRFGPLIDLPVDQFRAVLDVNLLGVFICSRAVARRMLPRRSGVIVSLSSINATHPGPGAGAYPATKAAVVSLTQQMSLEWAGGGLRVNAVAPGFIDAGMSAPIYANPRVRELRGSAVPQQRLGTAEEVAAAVLFLCSDQASYINGHELIVDGGVVNSVLSRLPRD